ncbi:MAG TPA: hypothetical protein VGX22_11295 [Candidatus Dormibacteraeota bacterium]|nr:hypothetical protein [Candidatus Dormibacteraeota bacterium]
MSIVRLAANRWAMDVRPERGGRITSLRLDGEELLDQGIGVDQPTAEGFVEGGAFGWDEMVPNLEPTDALPDHGEAWRLPWEVLGEGVMRCTGRLVTWQLERRISLGESVAVSYVYTNVGDAPHIGYWCAHPLLRYRSDMEISVDVARPSEGSSVKVVLPSGSVDAVRLGRVRLTWDSARCPDAAIWVCNGALGGYRQVAVEPSWTLRGFAPGQTHSWWLRIDAL